MPFSFDTFPDLHTPRLHLTEPGHEHAADLFRIYTHADVVRYYTAMPFKEEKDLLPVIDIFRGRFHAGEQIRWGMVQKGSTGIIGTIGIHNIAPGHKASVFFALHPDHWNKGYMTEALQPVLQFCFEQLDLRRIDAEVMPGNTASGKVLEKSGFVFEGLLKQWMMWKGKCYDMNMYSLVRGGG